jgi:ubiquinone biosynthesis monooxygenase Coq7
MGTVIGRILRVNHAGEHGAISIYSAQLAHLGARHTDLRTWLEETLAHERAHREAFRGSMQDRHVTPCGALAVWSVGGWVLGCLTALLGRRGVMACTAAVERAVHGHLEEQIAFLLHTDPTLAALVQEIQKEEMEHLSYAEDRIPPGSITARLVEPLIAVCTNALIALSTQGVSLTLNGELRRS